MENAKGKADMKRIRVANGDRQARRAVPGA
jgi:hypothetical protein